MNNELISIIVPVYREEEYLVQGITSLLNQTYKNIEIILVEDGSPDRCGEICDAFAAQDSRIKVIHRANAGLVSARKQGLSMASGSIIGYMDGDDWVEPEFYETLYKDMCESGADIIAAGYKEDILGHTEECKNAIEVGLYDNEQLKAEVFPKMICTENFSQFGIFTFLWNKLFRREVLYKNQMAVDNSIFIGEDAACLYPSILDSKSIYVSESMHYHYVQRPNSMIKSKSAHNENELIAINLMYNHLHKVFCENIYCDVLLPQLDRYMVSLATVRSECLLREELSTQTLFPFRNNDNVRRIAIVGAGTFGQHLYKRLSISDKYEIVFWGDDNYEQYIHFDLPVVPIEKITDTDFDAVIVAFIEKTSSEAIRTRLSELGVENYKIIVSDFYDADHKMLLSRFNIRLEN